MTMAERFNNDFYQYQKWQAEQRLNYGFSYIFDGREYDLLKDNYIHLNDSDTVQREKQKALKAVEELRACIAGEKVNPIYWVYWENQKDTEWTHD